MNPENFPENLTPQEKAPDKTAGKPEIVVLEDFDKYIQSKWPDGQFEHVDKAQYKDFLKVIDLNSEDVTLNVLHGDVDFLDVGSEYAQNIVTHQIFTLSSLEQERPELEDLVFVSKTSGKTFNAKSLMDENIALEIDPDLQFKAWGGPHSIQMAPLGRDNPPEGFIDRSMWNVYKKVEALTLFHEIAHSRQSFDFSNAEESVEAERDAWRFGLQCIRKLRELDIDLLPDVSNEQMISRLELGLLRYDSKHPEDLPKRFSSRFRENTTPGMLHDLRHFLRFVGAVLKTTKDDPSFVTETLVYKDEK